MKPLKAPRVSTAAVATIVVAVLTTLLGAADRAEAASGGAGASGRGDEIITSILAATGSGPGGGTGGGTGSTPVCRTHILGDRQILYLLHVAANMPELLEASFLDALEAYANTSVTAADPVIAPSPTTAQPTTTPPTTTPPGTTPPDTPTTTTTLPIATDPTVTYWELTVRICDGIADTMSVRPRTTTTSVLGASALAGDRLRHSTRLPPPVLRMSPPPRLGPAGVITSTIVGEPVFFSADPTDTVTDTIEFAGRTVEVEATPEHLELFAGEPQSAGRVLECKGFGVAYDAGSKSSVGEQAASPDACVLIFHNATGAPRRDLWHGYAALAWAGRYRVDGGPWHILDGLFSTSVFAISVGEVDTVIGDKSVIGDSKNTVDGDG